MTYAYDKICLSRAADTLGRMLDYSAHSLHYDISAMMDLFIASGVAALFECGDIRVIAGMSGVELAYEVLERSGVAFERMQPRYTKGLSPEYWCGHALVHIQWETCLPFHQIMRTFSPAAFISGYGKSRLTFLDSLPLDLSAGERSAKGKAFGKDFTEKAVSDFISATAGSKAHSGNKGSSRSRKSSDNNRTRKSPETSLKSMRLRNGLSQSGLAKASGIPVRTIQQYEQGQKDLSKARAEYLIALSRVLNCDPSTLLLKQQH